MGNWSGRKCKWTENGSMLTVVEAMWCTWRFIIENASSLIIRIYIYLLSSFGVTHMYMCVGLTIWDWITYMGAHLYKKLIFPSQQPLTSSNSSPRRRTMWNFPHPCWNVSWCSYVVLFRQHIVESSHFSCRVLGRLSSSRHPGPTALRTFLPLFNVPWALRVEISLQMYQML